MRIAALLLLGLGPPSGHDPGPTLDYVVSLADPATKSVQVELRIRGATAELELTGADPRDVSAEGGRVRQELGRVFVSPATGADEVVVNYEARLRRRELESVKLRNDEFQCSYVAADHALLFTEEVLVRPAAFDAGACRVRFDVPEGWAVLTPWKRLSPPDAGWFAPTDVSELALDIVALGKWVTERVDMPGFEATFAVAPGQPEVERLIEEVFPEILAAELELFDAVPCPRYLFVFGQIDIPLMGGSPRTRSMTMVVHPSLLPRMETGLALTLAHEFHHVWVMQRVFAEDDLRWMNEGFTDYFAQLVGARMGLIGWDELAAKVGDSASACLENPKCGEMSLAAAGGPPFFSDPDAHAMTYAGGLVVAAWLDRALRRHCDRTLDELMRWYVNEVHGPGEPGAASKDEFIRRVAEFGNDEIAATLARLVSEPFVFDPVALFEPLDTPVTVETGNRVVLDPLPWREHAAGTVD